MSKRNKLSSEEIRDEVEKFMKKIGDSMEPGDGRCLFMIVDDGDSTAQAMVGNIKNIGEALMRSYIHDEDTRKLLSVAAKAIMTFELLGPEKALEFVKEHEKKMAMSNVKAEA